MMRFHRWRRIEPYIDTPRKRAARPPIPGPFAYVALNRRRHQRKRKGSPYDGLEAGESGSPPGP